MESIPAPLTEAAEHHLTAYGITLRGNLSRLTSAHATPMQIDIDGRVIDINAVYLPRISAIEALRAAHLTPSGAPLLVVGLSIHESSATTLRAQGIWYVDAAGNSYLRHPGCVVDVRGRRQHTPMASERPFDFASTNPFTPKRAQVVLALLSRPELVNAPFREIAGCAGVSVGMAKSTMDTLTLMAFVEQIGPRRRLIRGDELLNLWASAYPGGLGRANTLLIADGDVAHWSKPADISFAISGEQAIPDRVRHPESLILYVDSDGTRRPPRELMLENRWRRDPDGNIVIRELFWRDLPGIDGRDAAPLPLVYADLLASHEPRQREVAQEMRWDVEQLVRS